MTVHCDVSLPCAMHMRVIQAELSERFVCRVNAQLGGGSTAVRVDADASWKSGGGADDSGNDSGSGTALRCWRVRVMQALTLAAVAACLWALVESILSTHGSAQRFWDVFDDAKQQVRARAVVT